MKRPRVLVAPLDWGLGHATRCIPIINVLRSKSVDVHLAGAGDSIQLLSHVFPDLPVHALPAYQPWYSRSSGMLIAMFLQLPKFIRVIRREHSVVGELVAQHQFDAVISDNRYGCWSKSARNVFISHQLSPKLTIGLRWMEPLVHRVHASFINRFDRCWVPDESDRGLSGELSLNKRISAQYIGNLSRFCLPRTNSAKSHSVLILLSGPEPQRTFFEHMVVEQAKTTHEPVVVVRGIVNGSSLPRREGSLTILDFADSDTLSNLICTASLVVCRSGYSTLMDLKRLGARAFVVPTPGQTEQEYLATHLAKRGTVARGEQQEFDLRLAIKNSEGTIGFTAIKNDTLLHSAVDDIMSRFQ